MNYYEVKIYTSQEGIEPLLAVLMALGHDTFVTEDPNDIRDFLEKKNVYDWDYVDEEVLKMEQNEPNITLYFEMNEDSRHQIDALKAAVSGLKKQDEGEQYGRLAVESRLVCDDDWKDRWKEFFKPARITENIIVKPSWEECEKRPGDKIIEIDPGMAFGTGTHPTTKMCIRMLQKYIEKGKDTVLDLGCGSGILSVAAVLCGARDVAGVDIDADAVRTAAENIRKNGVENDVKIMQGDVTKGLEISADIIVANLIAPLITGLAGDAAKHLSGKKIFISSGILGEQCDSVTESLKEKGFGILEVMRDEGWCTVAARLER